MSTPKILLHYEIRGRIGAGGMGEVFRAHDSKLDRDVAIKILPPDLAADTEFRRRFEREAKAIAALNHPHIVTIHSVEEAEKIRFLTMELVQGQSLDALIPSAGMPVADLLKYAGPLTDAVASAHEQGIIHRDLKPQNVMVDTKGQLKVLDFGLAKMTGAPSPTPEAATQTMITAYGESRVMGTVKYMSPEQAQGKDLDPRSDVFSLGVMLYEMATGKSPFGGDSPMSVLSSVIKDDPPPVHEVRSQLPPELSRILRRALAKDPERRYQTALGLRNDLQALEKDLNSPAGTRGSRRRYLIPISIFAALLAAFLISNPLKLELGINQPEAAVRERLAVLHFENLAAPDDPGRLGEIVSNLLITSLSQSDFLSVVSNQSLQELVKRRGEGDLKGLDRRTATEVAVQAGAKTMLLGSILKISPYVITSQLVDTETGEVLGSQRVDGEPGGELFALIDSLSMAVKRGLGFPGAAGGEGDLPVASVTTSSMDAYQLYVRAREKIDNFEGGAKEDLERAVAIDTTFAMAYFMLADPIFVQGAVSTIEEQQNAAMHAARLADRVTPVEQRYIRARYATLTGNIDEAIAQLEALVKLDPHELSAYLDLSLLYRDYKHDRQAQIYCLNRVVENDPTGHSGYNDLAYAYWECGDLEKAVWAINHAIRLAPDDPNSYDTRGEFYAWMGDLDKAIESYQAANRLNPGWGRAQLAYIYQERGDVARARAIYEEMGAEKAGPAARVVTSSRLAGMEARRGRLAESIDLLTRAMDTAEVDGYIGLWYWHLLIDSAKLHYFREEFDLAEADARRALGWAVKAASIDSILFWSDLIVMLSQQGEFETAEAELAALKKHTEQLWPRDLFLYWLARGWLEMERGDLNEACSSLEEGVRLEWKSVRLHYSLGVAYLRAGRGKNAVQELERVVRGAYWSERGIPVWSGLSYYQLGRAYEDIGRGKDAAAEYEAFLELFKDADPVFDEVEDARSRLDRLRTTS